MLSIDHALLERNSIQTIGNAILRRVSIWAFKQARLLLKQGKRLRDLARCCVQYVDERWQDAAERSFQCCGRQFR